MNSNGKNCDRMEIDGDEFDKEARDFELMLFRIEFWEELFEGCKEKEAEGSDATTRTGNEENMVVVEDSCTTEESEERDRLLAELIETGRRLAALPVVPTSTVFLAKISELIDEKIVFLHYDETTEMCEFTYPRCKDVYFNIVYVGFLGVVETIQKDPEKEDTWWILVTEKDSDKSIPCRLQMQHNKDEIDEEYKNRLIKFRETQQILEVFDMVPTDYDEKCLMSALQATRKKLTDNKASFCFKKEALVPVGPSKCREGRRVFITGKLAYVDNARIVFLNSVKLLEDDKMGQKEEHTIRKMIENRDKQL